MNKKEFKRYISFALSIILVLSVIFSANTGVNIKASATGKKAVDSISIWSGSAASNFAGGSGTVDNPYIIETADQLYLALTQITDTTNNVAGGKQTSEILKQSSTTEYVPVYTPYYYKVADGVQAFYLNDIRGYESLEGIKSFVENSTKQEWKPGKSFVGNLDGNGVKIYGMYSPVGQGLIYKLDGSATVKNINFDSCYSTGSGNVALLTTQLGSYINDSTIHTVANISVRNSFMRTTRNIDVKQREDNVYYNHNPGAAGIVSTNSTAEDLIIINCLYDGYSCERIIGNGSEATADMMGAIISGGNTMNNVTLNGCVSLGAPAVDEVIVPGEEVFYSRYDKNVGFQVFFYGSYTDLSHPIPQIYHNKYDKLLDIKCVDVKNVYNMYDMPELDWRANWELVTVDGQSGRTIPMPKVNKNIDTEIVSYSLLISKQNNGGGAYSVFGGAYNRGTYGMYHDLYGSGTAADPYLITNAFELARAIASGGMNVYNKLYYKLACDIDASGASWITKDAIKASGTTDLYQYVPFNGVLDGDGHTVTGIFAGDDKTVGLIPMLDANGVVKNLHIRDCYFLSGSEYAGAIAGEFKEGAVITGCSVEDCLVGSKKADLHIAGEKFGKIENSYYIAKEGSSVSEEIAHYNDSGKKAEIDLSQNGDIWYKGGKDGSTPKLKNYTLGKGYADIDGDGIVGAYSATDLVAIRRRLLLAEGYEYADCDVNRDGKVNISDLAVLNRSIVGDYDKLYDGFWRNAELGEISIYYGENDNYDAARRLEIYLETQLRGVDIKKVVSADKTVSGTESNKDAVYVHANDSTGTPKGSLEIIVGNIANYDKYKDNILDINDYSITFDDANCVLWLNGGSFTGVEQAVIDFINKSDENTSFVYTVDKATLAPEKRAKTVMVDTNYDGKADANKVLYYAWGDEFDGVKEADANQNAEILIDTWNHSRMRTETEVGKSGNYNNVESVNEKELSNLYWVEDGKLTITRGVKAEHATSETDKLNYVRLYNQNDSTAFSDIIDDDDVIANPGLIKTNHSMLWKQGYAEMYGSLPSDGHTFASWWMLGHGLYNNYAMDETLYGKVYKLNNTGEYAYDGKSTWAESTDPKTYKYQVPTNYFEIDIWELMQSNGIAASYFQQNKTTGFYDYRLYLNVHKFYSVGARGKDVVNVIDWNNPGNPRAVMQKEWFGSKEYYFSTSAAYHDFTDGTNTRFTYDEYKSGFSTKTGVSANYIESLQKQLTAPRRYGFYWETNGVDKFNLTLYIYDANGDGNEDDTMILGTSDMTYNKDNGKNPQDYDCVDDAEVANQYMYFLFDNVLYSSNPKHKSSTTDNAAMHTDMLTDEGTAAAPDKIDLEIDYIRVYQYDGRRDIITRETEDFNNGNHFGY
ncbi:MAG: dockerin type I repeat-containing protein [Clostridia bacterium]|nr:dockerin type I repeat-containing protein [Clostridia bacterium]